LANANSERNPTRQRRAHTIVRSVTICTFSKIRNVGIDYKSAKQSHGLHSLEKMGELVGVESRN
jgi:hypothetical protein